MRTESHCYSEAMSLLLRHDLLQNSRYSILITVRNDYNRIKLDGKIQLSSLEVLSQNSYSIPNCTAELSVPP